MPYLMLVLAIFLPIMLQPLSQTRNALVNDRQHEQALLLQQYNNFVLLASEVVSRETFSSYPVTLNTAYLRSRPYLPTSLANINLPSSWYVKVDAEGYVFCLDSNPDTLRMLATSVSIYGQKLIPVPGGLAYETSSLVC